MCCFLEGAGQNLMLKNVLEGRVYCLEYACII